MEKVMEAEPKQKVANPVRSKTPKASAEMPKASRTSNGAKKEFGVIGLGKMGGNLARQAIGRE